MKQGVIEIRLLPYRYKKIGYWLLGLALPIAFAIVMLLLASGMIMDEDAFFDEWSYPILYYPFTAGLGLLVFSEERHEDEMVQNLRYKAFMSGVFFLVIALLLLPFYSNIYTLVVNQAVKMPDVGGMLGALNLLLVYIYTSFKYNLYYMRKKLGVDEE